MPDIEDILKRARPREHTVRVCIAGDVAAEVDRLEAELASLSDWKPGSMADQHPGIELAERISAAREQMRAAEVSFTFRALGRLEWSDLVAQHPGQTADEAWDSKTLPLALVSACAIDPVMTPEQVDDLFETLNEAQRQQLIEAAWQVNGEGTSIPFSLHASAILASRTDGK
ncbi:hypothetical protein OG393_31055 [Streptomyces sp. NBC_01216]|uniref:hypothetical protein n=1 Tax=Streptomyces sp. NBC_01216 TaxID=2903778 RepID=UPI002E0EB76C|nr:hypothetical protein OG393_31055 [Streptomyces sp. NBC_01216]